MMPSQPPQWQLPNTVNQPRFDLWSGEGRISDPASVNQFCEEMRQKDLRRRIQKHCEDKLETLRHEQYDNVADEEDQKADRNPNVIIEFKEDTESAVGTSELYEEELKQRELKEKIIIRMRNLENGV